MSEKLESYFFYKIHEYDYFWLKLCDLILFVWVQLTIYEFLFIQNFIIVNTWTRIF
jgi:hypothetical protein